MEGEKGENMTMDLRLGDCLIEMNGIPDGSVDLTVTSPPYDNLRTYNGYVFDFEGIAKELFRVTKEGGVVVWVVGDATIKGSETGTSFKQALYFKDIGFNLHDTMIWRKNGVGACGSNYAYWQAFEYMFVFSKGKPKSTNRIKDKVNKTAGMMSRRTHGGRTRKYGATEKKPVNKTEKLGYRENVWKYQPGNINERTGHPAPFPEQLAHDHIISWSSEGDTVLDPMMGSGTTGKVAKILKRKFIGIEISEEYFKIAKERIENTNPLKL